MLLWLLFGLISGGLILFQQFEYYATSALDNQLSDEMEDLKRDAQLVAPGTLEFQSPTRGLKYQRVFSGWYWQLDSPTGNLDHSRSLFDGPLPFDWTLASVDGSFQSVVGPRGQSLRVLTTYSDFDAGRLYLAVAANRERVDDLLQVVKRFLWIAIPLIGLFLVATISIQIRIGLRPLRRIASELREVRDGQRAALSSDYPSELGPLAEEINQLQRANATLVDRAQRLVGNLAHALKTPLAVLQNEAEAVNPSLLQQVGDMRGQIDRYLAQARTAAVAQTRGLRAPLLPALQPLANTLEKIYRAKGVTIGLDLPPSLLFLGEERALTECLGNLLDNAAKWCRTEVRITARPLPGRRLELVVEDDGAGIPEAARSRALRRGQRLDESTPGTGLGLSIVQDFVEAYGGSLALEQSGSLGGLAVRLTLPGVSNRPAAERD